MDSKRWGMMSLNLLLILTVLYVAEASQNLLQSPRKVRALKNLLGSEETRPCIPKDYGKGSFVCICNSTYCDSVRLTIPSEIANGFGNTHSNSIGQSLDERNIGGDLGGIVQIFTSSKTGSRLHKSIVQFNNNPEEPYHRNDMLSRHDDLRARSARSEGSDASPRPDPFIDIGRRNTRRNGGGQCFCPLENIPDDIPQSLVVQRSKSDFDPILNDINTFRTRSYSPRGRAVSIRKPKTWRKQFNSCNRGNCLGPLAPRTLFFPQIPLPTLPPLKVTLPKLPKLPDINLPALPLPKLPIPDINLPNLLLPKLPIPEIELPELPFLPQSPNLFPDYPRPEKLIKYTIQRDKKYQKVLGYGGAFTDAAGLNIKKLSPPAQEQLMRSYFGQEGIDYRLPIGGSDFSLRPYTLDDDVEDLGGEDANLSKFALQTEDLELKIPFIHWAKSLSGHDMKFFGSPWSAPGWMKTSGRLHGLGKLKKEYYQLWADYFVKFIQSYQQQGVEIWGLTTGNEPFNGFIPLWPFNCMGWSASDMKKFIVNNLGPTLAAAGLSPKVMILDDNKSSVSTWAREILSRNDSAQYVHGVGTHWYLDFLTSPDVLSRFHENYPDYFIVQTEACLGFTPWELEKVSLGNWERGEQYLEAIIHDSRNWVGAWIDWNLALDLKGGPNWAGLKADAAILVNETSDEFYKQPIYYGIGHVSKFVPPDSERIELTLDTYAPKNLMSVAFRRPDGGIVIVFLNKLNYDARVGIRDPEKGYLYVDIPPKSFQTLVYW